MPTPLPIPPPNLSDTVTLAELKRATWERIQKYPMEMYPQIELLVHQLASAQLDFRFQKAYLAIFGSQQRLLQELNRQMGSGIATRAMVQQFLVTEGMTDERIKKHSFENWIGFLVSSSFINVGVDTFALTPTGQDFLVWVLRQQLPPRTYEGV